MALPSLKRLSQHSKRALLVLGALVLAIWLVFIDSHSIWKRVAWHRELNQLQRENAALETRIQALEQKLDEGPTDEDIEHIAREAYGMRRPGETVYRVEKE